MTEAEWRSYLFLYNRKAGRFKRTKRRRHQMLYSMPPSKLYCPWDCTFLIWLFSITKIRNTISLLFSMKFWTGIISEYFIWSSIHGSLFFRFMVSSGFISRIWCLESLFRKSVILIQEFCEFPTPFCYFKRMFEVLRYCFGGLYLLCMKFVFDC